MAAIYLPNDRNNIKEDKTQFNNNNKNNSNNNKYIKQLCWDLTVMSAFLNYPCTKVVFSKTVISNY